MWMLRKRGTHGAHGTHGPLARRRWGRLLVALGKVRVVGVIVIMPGSTVVAAISSVISVVNVGVPEIGVAAVWVHTQAIGWWCGPLLLWRLWRLFRISVGIRVTVVLFLFGEEAGHRLLSPFFRYEQRQTKEKVRERDRGLGLGYTMCEEEEEEESVDGEDECVTAGCGMSLVVIAWRTM